MGDEPASEPEPPAAPEPQVEGFEQVYAAERLAITRLSFLLVGSQAVAEELAQEAFLRLYQRFADVENPAGFLRTAVVRLSLTWQSRHQMECERLALVGVPPPTETPEIDETWDALRHLRPERRTVLVLRFYEQMQYEEIATVVGCSAGTVRSRARRALDDLGRELS